MRMLKEGYCPNCDAKRKLVVKSVKENYPVRGEPVTVNAEVAFCEKCGHDVFDRELDSANLERAYAEYRRKKGLPSPGEIVALREKYGLGQRSLAKLLGWSPSTVYRYEKGAVPIPAHGEALKRLADPVWVADLLKVQGGELTPREYRRVKERLDKLLKEERMYAALRALEKKNDYEPSIESGFRRFNFEKLLNMIIYFTRQTGVFKVALMKYLWYADFLHFKRHAVSISGARYAALPNGPALDNWMLCLQAAVETGDVSVEPVVFSEYEGEIVTARTEVQEDVFAEDELKTLEEVARCLGGMSSRALADLSHKEDGWKETPSNNIISYEYALKLKWK